MEDVDASDEISALLGDRYDGIHGGNGTKAGGFGKVDAQGEGHLTADEQAEFERLQRLRLSAIRERIPPPVIDEGDLKRLRESL